MTRHFLLVLFFSCIAFPGFSFAQDNVPVRTSSRDAYSRVVFDWNEKSKYTLDESEKGAAIITFSRPGHLDTSEMHLGDLANIFSLEELSEDPLKVRIKLYEQSKTRIFNTAERVFFDVYNPPAGTPLVDKKEEQHQETAAPAPQELDSASKPEVKESRATQPQTTQPKQTEQTAQSDTAQSDLGTKDKMPAEPPAYVLVPEVMSPQKSENAIKTKQPEEEHVDAQKLADAVQQNEHVFSVTSTSSVDLAIFKNFGQLWFVVDQEGYSIKPILSSPDPQIFNAIDRLKLPRGNAFKTNFPDGMTAKAQGGNLAWRLILSESGKIRENKYINPKRTVSPDSENRGGHIIWPLTGIGQVLNMKDPVTGQKLYIVTVNDSSQAAGEARSFIDFDVLTSYVGLVIRPKVDDLIVSKTPEGIEISRPHGLALMKAPDVSILKQFKDKPFFDPKKMQEGQKGKQGNNEKQSGLEKLVPKPGLFNFKEWKTGDINVLNDNENAILSTLHDQDDTHVTESLIKLAKMYLSYGMGPEALGFLDFARQKLPQLEKSSEFIAMRGVARALTNKSEVALSDLLNKNLGDFDDIKFWKSYVLADLGDWQQAAKVLPKDYGVLYGYPEHIRNKLALVLAEVNLREGRVNDADLLLAMVEEHPELLDNSMSAALDYLRGESYRQKGNVEKALSLWEGLENNKDDLYRTKAKLALTVLLKDLNKINAKQAIDRLEHLRYAWRGDQLEAQINYWLGKYYFDIKDYAKGLNIMREAASIAGDTKLGRRVASDMRDEFSELFLSDELDKISAIDAAAIYEGFTELTPAGDQGDKLVQRLAEKLADADLLERAEKLLRQQVAHRLSGEDKIRVALRLASIELLDKQPDNALSSLKQAEDELKNVPQNEMSKARTQELMLLKARAYAEKGNAQRGLAILDSLSPDDDVYKLTADIAWQQGYWDDAAAALDNVLQDENISASRPLTDKQTEIIMKRAIALNLANDRVALANMRKKYSDLMLQTTRAHQFELITRPHSSAELADRDTLKSIVSEVDLFDDFLKSYRSSDK